MSVIFTTIKLKTSILYDNNPLVDIKNVAYIHAGYKESDSCKANEPKFFGEGMVDSMLPYFQQDNYSSELVIKDINVAIIENNYLKATILLDFGGRLYSLYDKKDNRELLYKNEVIKFCNLSLLNAWFSGGVEWNVSIKGHNPLTCSKMFSSIIKVDNEEALRIYEYERKRRVCYSIDFILEKNSKFLVVIPRIENTENLEKYNYWWSNIAVKETKNTRIIVPAEYAYISSYNKNAYYIDYFKVPNIDGRDTSYPKSSPCSNDYFYKIKDEDEKWIAAIEEDGKGFIEGSTKLLKGRKMFVWGDSEGGRNWQKLLSNNKDSYTEIQAGLLETQLQHLKMAPNSKLEWVEIYGPLSIDKEKGFSCNYNDAIEEVNKYLIKEFPLGLNDSLKGYLDKKIETIEIKTYGSGFGALNNYINKLSNIKPISNYLEFPIDSVTNKEKVFYNFLENGYIKETDINECPMSIEISDFIKNKIIDSLKNESGKNWTSYYILGTICYGLMEFEDSLKYWILSYESKPNAWSARNISMYYKNVLKDYDNAYNWILKAYNLSKELYILKDFAITLLDTKHYSELIEYFDTFSDAVKESGRMRFYKAFALNKLDRNNEAKEIINYDFYMHDVREGEISISDLWYKIYGKLLLKDFDKLSIEEVISKIDEIMPLKNQDFRMHK